MKPSEVLKPGMIGVNLKGAIDPLGTFDTLLQGDTDGAHAWWVLPNGKIATTGAESLIIYGEVEPDVYLKGKHCYLLETVDALSEEQLQLMASAHQCLMQSGLGRIYGFWKFAWIWILAFRHGFVTKTGKKPEVKKPFAPICSQAVAFCFWAGGVPIGKSQGKEDWTAVLPETIIKEAKQTSYDLSQGLLKPTGEKPCMMLTLVDPYPYQF